MANISVLPRRNRRCDNDSASTLSLIPTQFAPLYSESDLSANSSTPTVLRPQGHLTRGNAAEFEAQLRQMIIHASTESLLIDFTWVYSLDNAALMAFVNAAKLARRLKRRLCFYSVSPAIQMIFELSQLDRVFEILTS